MAQIPAVRLSSGTHPPGSVWTRNPIPLEEGMIPPIPGLPQLSGRGPFPYSVVDEVVVPKGLERGAYTLSWRWVPATDHPRPGRLPPPIAPTGR